jgi:NADH-quinone oxidoreductase subunit E/NADP-reducing hydrogenase subunit HndA
MTIQKLLLQFKPKTENVLPLLHKVNEAFGYISRENFELIVDYFDVSEEKVYGLISSSRILKLSPRPKMEIEVCTNPSCKLEGSDEVILEIEKYYKIKVDRENNRGVSLKRADCFGRCLDGPVVKINGNFYEKVTPNRIDDILRDFDK